MRYATSLRLRAPGLLAAALTLVLSAGLLAGTAAPATASAQEVSFTPVADTWVDSSRPTSSFGRSSRFVVDAAPDRQAYLRFDLSSLAGRTITGVRLRLHQVDASRTGGRVHAMSSSAWTESTTWDTRPAVDGRLLATFGAVSSGSWYDVALDPAAVRAGPVSFAMSSSSSDGAYWASRESSTDPELVVTATAPEGEETAFGAVADTWVGSASPSAPHGASLRMAVDAKPAAESYLRFDLGALAGRTVTAARLRLHQVDSSATGGQVHGLSSRAWTEKVTWDTRPAIDGPLLATFGAVTSGRWYEVALDPAALSTGLVSFALTSTSADGASWATRESTTKPELVVTSTGPAAEPDALTQVAAGDAGSSEPTYFSGSKRLAVTAGGRTLAIHGSHLSGVQLRWRDGSGAWQTSSTGSSGAGELLAGTGTGDWAASIALATGPSGAESAWVVWSGPTTGYQRTLQLRRLTDLDGPGGPVVGPAVTLDATVGSYKSDIAIERAPDGTLRAGVLWTRPTDDGAYEVTVAWLTDLGTDTPALEQPTVLHRTKYSSQFASLVATPVGLAAVARAGSSGATLSVYRHDAAAALTTWTAAASGPALPSGAFPTGTALANGDLLVVVEEDLTAQVTGVYRWTIAGAVTQLLRAPGLAQPTIASDGARAWLVGVRAADGALVSHEWSQATGWAASGRVEVAAEVAGRLAWPNALRQTDGRLRVLAEGPGASASTSSVWAYDRPL